MDPELDKCASLISQTFGLAHDLNLSVIVGIELPTLRRCWSSNCVGFRTHFVRSLAVLGDEDFWLESNVDRCDEYLADEMLDNVDAGAESSLNKYYDADVKIDLDNNSASGLDENSAFVIDRVRPVVCNEASPEGKTHLRKTDDSMGRTCLDLRYGSALPTLNEDRDSSLADSKDERETIYDI